MIKPQTQDAGHFHAVRFYESPESLCRIVADFLAEGLIAKEPALVVATPEHRAGILQELHARHFDVARMEAAGDLLMLDAREMLDDFMVDGMPDARRFTAAATAAIERVCRGRTDCTIRAYGEMVDVLWKDNQSVAAVRLEMLWNQLAKTHDFSLLCGYAMGSFYKGASVAEVCDHHTHIVSADGTVAPVTPSRLGQLGPRSSP